jgi:hypothetical protein
MSFIPDIQNIIAAIEGAFQLIFPEFPAVGLVVCLLAFFLFAFYLIRAGLKAALKISIVTFAIMIFTLYSVHTLYRIVTI